MASADLTAEADALAAEERVTERWRKEALLDPSSDMTRPSLAALTDAGHPFSIPWTGDVRTISAGFDSSKMMDTAGPWLSSCPFDLDSLRLKVMLPETKGGTSSYRDGFSTHSGSSLEHLSAEVGVTVGYPFLSAGVSGKYDKTVQENEDGVQVSRNASCRVGRIVLDNVPALSPEAIVLLRSRSGPSRFRALYGDYFVCGYELGGDAGACLSASKNASSSKEILALTVTVKVLFVKASKTFTKTTTHSSASSGLVFSGYSTFGQKSLSISVSNTSAGEQEKIQQAAGEYLAVVGELPREVRKRMRKLKLRNGQNMPLSAASNICGSGLVVQLLLTPFARLNQYVQLLNQPPLDGIEQTHEGDGLDGRLAVAAKLLLAS